MAGSLLAARRSNYARLAIYTSNLSTLNFNFELGGRGSGTVSTPF